MEKLRIETTRKNLQFCRIESALYPALPVFFRVDENGVELAVKPVHVTPGDTFEKAVFGQDADVLGEISVIDTACLQVKHFGREQRRQSDRPRRADNDLAEPFPLNVIKDLQNRRETQFLQLVLRQLEFADRFKILDRDVVDRELVARGDHD